VCPGTRAAARPWSNRDVERACVAGMAAAAGFSDLVGYGMYLPIGYRCGPAAASLCLSPSPGFSGPRRPSAVPVPARSEECRPPE